MTDFSFISNEKLRSVVERNYAELQKLDPEGSPKAVVVLAGAVLEGLLADALAASGKWDFDSACQQRLADMIGPAKERGIIKQDQLSNTVKNYRALIHPGREVREGIELTKDDAVLAKAAVEITIRSVSRWHKTQTRAPRIEPAPEPLSPDKRRTFLRASEYSIDVRIDAATSNTFLVMLTNNSDEEFEVAGAIAQWQGASLGTVARPAPGSTWRVLPRGRSVMVRWPDSNSAIATLMSMHGVYDHDYKTPIDLIFDCVLDDDRREFKKRVIVQVDPTNYRAIQL